MTAADHAPGYVQRSVDPARDPGWAQLMSGRDGSLFGSPPWIAALIDTYGFDIAAEVLDDENGHAVAGFAYTEIDDVRGSRIVSLPFGDRLDPVLTDPDQLAMLLQPALSRQRPITLRCLNTVESAADHGFAEAGRLAWHETDTRRAPEEMLVSLSAGARRNIRVSEQRGARVRIGSRLEDVHAFHVLQCATRKYKYRLLAQPIGFFEALWNRFSAQDGIFVVLAEQDGDTIGGALYLRWQNVLYYKFGASLLGRLAARPNEAVQWAGLKLAHGLGCTSVDLGVSDLDQPGLVNYKRKYATAERDVRVLKCTPPGYQPAASTDAAWLGTLTGLLTRDDVPDEVTRAAGEALYRFFA